MRFFWTFLHVLSFISLNTLRNIAEAPFKNDLTFRPVMSKDIQIDQ